MRLAERGRWAAPASSRFVRRWARVIRQLLTESILLAGLGGALGVLLVFWGTKAVLGTLPATVPRANEVSLDSRVLLFTVALSLLAGIVFGLAPALKTSRVNLQQMLKQSGRGGSDIRLREPPFLDRDGPHVSRKACVLIFVTGSGPAA
jgi:hypothetical protein